MTGEIDVRNLSREEVATLLDWAAKEGWNPSPHDAQAFYDADPAGFLGCFVDGVFASGISAIAYGDSFGFIGLYITQPEFRGKGYGLKVWNAGISRLAGRTIGLDGVPAQQENYQRMGFRRAYGSARWSGNFSSITSNNTIRRSVPQDILQILPFDRRHFPASRTRFLRGWLEAPRIAVISERDGALAGYAVIRRCLEGWKIGPLFADGRPIALDLLGGCSQFAAGSTVHLDVPDSQTEFAEELQQMGFQRGFETARMYLGPQPDIDMSGVFAVTTLELG